VLVTIKQLLSQMGTHTNPIHPNAEWIIEFGGEPDTVTVEEECASVPELLEKCGRALYGDEPFKVLSIRLFHESKYEQELLGYTFKSTEGREVEWLLKSLGPKDELSCRFLEAKHEAFAMIIAEMRRGSKYVELWHRFVCIIEK
jgi:hypothetical protein